MTDIHNVIAACPYQVPVCHLRKAVVIDKQLKLGTPFPALNGLRVKKQPSYIRFKLGRSWRLVYLRQNDSLVPCFIVSRQAFEDRIKRRCCS